ncbi:hypothetical protein FGG08_001910 [Glutinoglossum americanum]|uniref:Shugoshin C-terminal domain-containing protein n=1 Tax=Glutinoglossum americanum TaxID=1670608 RepID=A0A9P8IE08_9PEZI|nr:hypothetical protein FGG08_001910 [Glutinoglossum americanum]
MRVNSTQSLRIRNLEAEISRLLAENVSLREQIIKLQAQADRNSGRHVLENVEGFKRILEGKLLEIGELVGGLGAISLDVSPRAYRARRSPGQDQKNWKNTFTLSEVTSHHEGRLPPILEDKLYPRRSIEYAPRGFVICIKYVANSVTSSNEPYQSTSDPASAPDSSLSPEIGPPPIAHFEEEPVKFDPNRRVNVESMLGTDIGDGIGTYQPVNPEKRKIRRDSAKLSEILRSTEAHQDGQRQLSVIENQMVDVDASQPLRTGAKRKLSARDEDEKPEKNRPIDFDDFKFNRRVTTGRGKDEHQPKTNTQPIGSKEGGESIQESEAAWSTNNEKPKKQTPIVSSRKALGPKSTNTDPVASPVKTRKAIASEDITKQDAGKKATEQCKVRDKRSVIVAPKPKLKGLDVNLMKLEPSLAQRQPETPCPPDLLSPVDSQPSTVRPISRDTPPPPDLDPSSATADGLISAARATRRPRGSINYAEPNLRDKMRRPTKELVDAVTGEGKGHRASGVRAEGSRSTDEEGPVGDKNQIRTVFIKREEGPSANRESSTVLGRAYKTAKARECEDGSPLNFKSGGNGLGELPSSIITQRRRRTSALHRDDEECADQQSTAAAAAAALSELRKKPSKSGDRRTDIAIQNAMEKLQALDIYDFKGSSPSTAGDSTAELPTTRMLRRPSPLDVEDEISDTDAVVNGSSSCRGGKRRQTLALSGSAQAGDIGSKEGGIRATRSVVNLGSRRDGEGDGEGGGGAGAVGMRAAGRRRSMML